MNRKSQVLFKAFLQHFHGGEGGNLIKYLPDAEIKKLEKVESYPADLANLAPAGGKGMSYFHYSWLGPAIEKMPKALQPLCLASLPPRKGAKVATFTRRSLPKQRPIPMVRGLLLDMLFQKLVNPKVLPRGLLPRSELSMLLKLQKRELVDLIDYLGIHDLASSMKHIVDKERVQQIIRALAPKKRNYLKQCLRGKNPLKTPDMKLKTWDGEPKSLELQLQIRGLTRLSKALSGQDPSVLWHLAHQLDIGRGRALMRQVKPNEVPGVTPFLTGQIQNIVRYMSN